MEKGIIIVTIDSATFRKVLGHYPTGICIVTAIDDGAPVGMVVGSFTSVSLDPPLVAFFPQRGSSSWPRVEAAGRFCVNVLAGDQLALCQGFAKGGAEKFSRISHRLSSNGSPIIDDVLAWIDCDVHQVHEAGDHFIALGHVRELEVEKPGTPLLFFRGGYGEFSGYD